MGTALTRLLHRLMKIHRGAYQDGPGAVRECLEQTEKIIKSGWVDKADQSEQLDDSAQETDPATPLAAPYHELLTDEQHIEREVALAHIMTLSLKAEVARGMHMADVAMQGLQPKRWTSRSDVRETQVTLAGKALHEQCPGVVLNLLLDWNTGARLVSDGFLGKFCALHLRTRGELEACAQLSRRVYAAVVIDQPRQAGAGRPCNRGTTTRFVDALWDTDNLAAGVAILGRLATAAASATPDHRPVDQLISSLAIQLMEAAARFGQINTAHQVFDMCTQWLQQSTVAYNILLYPLVNEYDMPRVVRLLQRMRDNGAMPDTVTWTTIMSGMCRNGKLLNARKLFSAHLLFLPLQPPPVAAQAEPLSDKPVLYSPLQRYVANSFNLWETWYYSLTNPQQIDTFIWTWLLELATRYHREQQLGASDIGAVRLVEPWLPTQATHYILLKYLCRNGEVAQAAEYMALLKRVWGQYSAWSWTRRASKARSTDDSGGLERLERLVTGYISQGMDQARAVYGLGRKDAAPSQLAGSPCYYAHRDVMLALAWGDRRVRPRGQPHGAPSDRPPRVVYIKALHGYALEGDIRSLLYHMQQFPELNDIAAWSCIVRCICVQIAMHPDDKLMVRPYAYSASGAAAAAAENSGGDWLDFVFELARALAARRVYFTQVTFGIAVQMAAQLEDIGGVVRIAKLMHDAFEVRFNSDMLKMVLGVDFPYSAKCALVKSALDAHRADGMSPAKSIAKPGYPALAHLARLAETPEDVAKLCAIADQVKQDSGMTLLRKEHAHLRDVCIGHASAGWLEQWLATNSE
ncbi:hypothetical protein H4R19_000775 [Coemansia spiralis]|nr:hypothetical protein H4R19_000775 [Coemansia spiralis]